MLHGFIGTISHSRNIMMLDSRHPRTKQHSCEFSATKTVPIYLLFLPLLLKQLTLAFHNCPGTIPTLCFPLRLFAPPRLSLSQRHRSATLNSRGAVRLADRKPQSPRVKCPRARCIIYRLVLGISSGKRNALEILRACSSRNLYANHGMGHYETESEALFPQLENNTQRHKGAQDTRTSATTVKVERR